MDYIIYVRKSTESEDRQALSIQSQIIEMKEIAKREKLNVVKIFQESKSAKEPGRPVFNKMIEFIKQNKKMGVLCWKIDRLARNPVDEGLVKWLLQKEIIGRIKTFERDYNPEDNVVIASIEFGMANQYIRDLSNNVKRGLAEKIRRGEYPGCAPIGYIRNLKTKKLELDKSKSFYIKKAFELYSSKKFSIRELADELYNDGLRSNKNKRVGKTVIQGMLNNPIYCGLFRWKEQIYKGTHLPIITKSKFDKVQKLLFPFKYLHSVKESKSFAFRGLMTCGECGLKITAEKQKGHVYYRCTKSRGTKNCSQKYLREKELLDSFGDVLQNINFDVDVLDLIVSATKEKWLIQQKYRKESEAKLTEILKQNNQKQDSLVEKFIDNYIPTEIYNRRLSELRSEEAGIEEKLQNVKTHKKDIIEKIELIAKFVKSARDIFENGSPKVKKDIISLLSSNITIENQKITSFTLSEPFSWLHEDMQGFSTINRTFEPSFFGITKTKTAPRKSAVFSMRGRPDSNRRPIA